MENTTKHETVLELVADQGLYVQFANTPDEDGVPGMIVKLGRNEWRDLGAPNTVTIAAWSGDKLNSQPFTRAVREELDEETQKAYVEFIDG